MEVYNVSITENCLKMNIAMSEGDDFENFSPSYTVHFVEVQIKRAFHGSDTKVKPFLGIKFKNCFDDNLLYAMYLTSESLNIHSKKIILDDCDFRLVTDSMRPNFDLEIKVSIEKFKYFEDLYTDDLLTDFQIEGTNGSIYVHKVILAARSSVFRKMLSHDLKEKKEAKVALPYTQELLEHLKKFLYSDLLPTKNIKELLLIANCYIMPDLELRCINRLLFNISAQNTIELLQFALENNITILLIGILEKIGNNGIVVQDIKKRIKM